MNTTLRVVAAATCAALIVISAVLGGSYLGLAAPFSGDVYESIARGPVTGTERVENPYGRATVRYDEYGVPHISAANEKALYYAVGYVQARDRLFQMDLQRRLIGGNLSAAFGERAVESDRFYRKMDFRSAADASWRELEGTEAGAGLKAYTAGVNRYIDTGARPPEFALLGYEPTRWEPADSLLIGKLIAWRLSGNFADLRRATLKSRLGPEATSELYPDSMAHNTPIIRNGSDAAPFDPAAVATDASATRAGGGEAASDFAALYDAVEPFESKSGVGSNNWVVSGENTASGTPLLANDPHLSLSTPAVWYEMHTTAGESMDARGVTFPGVPFVIIGRTADVAWGVTNVGGDFTDEYTYETRNGRYLYDGEYREFETTTETIPVADAPDATVEVRKSVHGPVIERGGRTVGVAWPGFSATNESVGVYRLNHAETMADVRDALRIWDVPAQNFVAATRAGETLYYPAGRYPIRVTDGEVVRGDQIFNGSAGEGEWPGYTPYGTSSWSGFVPFESIPHVDDPDVLATANQRTTDDPPFYMGTSLTYSEPYRGARIYEMLDARTADGATPEDMLAVQRDVRSRAAVSYATIAHNASAGLSPDARELATELEEWDGEMRADSRGALVTHLFREEFVNATFADEFSAVGLDAEYYPNPYVTAGLAADSQWFDDDRTDATETRADVARIALERTADRIDRHGYETYGDVNRLDLNHPFDREFLNWPERPMNGSQYTVSNFRSGGDSVGSSWRMVVAFEGTPAEDTAKGVIPGGQSGVFWSDHYHDQLDEWATGEYKPLTLDSPPGEPDIVFESDLSGSGGVSA
ncbi:penicillin acylase family protein [Halogeometricum borinquense]|uniref:Penicillin acylase family protein n=1 Tax=Halogeometricum borinquense TaxID=60847 RepID=A0A6C0UHJ5_9EURY|nr:penicillin acylase family protein [Halogeometricum borinquense]QIB73741.1 penicillin acylase family protein [Halogeometricum borinquense]QIQ76901.1 penicillin acylase family protein [Halogeometricum borinquense]